MRMNKTNAALSVSGCLLVQLCVGIIYLWSVLKSAAAVYYGLTDAAASMVSPWMLAGFVVGGLMGGLLCDRRGPRLCCFLGVTLFSAGIISSGLLTAQTAGLLKLTYAGAGGLGSGVAYSACVSCVQKWMPGKRGLASGLAIAAFGLSTVAFAPLMRWLLGIFAGAGGIADFSRLFPALGGVFFVLGTAGCIAIRRPPQPQETQRDETGEGLSRALRTQDFWRLFFLVFFINAAWNLATPLFYDLGVQRGLTPAAATLAISLTGVFNTAGRLIMASLSDRLGRGVCLRFLAFMTSVSAVALMRVRGGYYVAALCMLAFAYGGPSSVNAALTSERFGPKHSASVYGAILLALGASSVCFNLVRTELLRGDVAASFAVGAVCALVSMELAARLSSERGGTNAAKTVGTAVSHTA